MYGRWRSFILKVVIAALLAWLLASAPLPSFAREAWFPYVQVPVVVFVLICYIGKLMLDTFFYNHYRP